jgi:eukaryotic translation initiation factor 2C
MLCYTFGRSTTGVSYAAPAYIADRLCERGRAYIREWAEDKFAVSVFNYKSYQDAQGRPRKPTNAEMAVEKTAMVRQLLTHKGFWGMYDDTGPKDKQRLNPWHPDLDDGMFWM